MTISRFRQFASTKLGRCPKCFRASFTGAFLGWVALALALKIVPSSWRWFVLIWPLSFSILWLLHMLTFARRFTTADSPTHSHPILGRRRALATFAGAFAFALLASTGARAQQPACGACSTYCGQQRSACCYCVYNNCASGCASGDNTCINKCLTVLNNCGPYAC